MHWKLCRVMSCRNLALTASRVEGGCGLSQSSQFKIYASGSSFRFQDLWLQIEGSPFGALGALGSWLAGMLVCRSWGGLCSLTRSA